VVRGLDSSNVGVDKDSLNVALAEGLDSLRTCKASAARSQSHLAVSMPKQRGARVSTRPLSPFAQSHTPAPMTSFPFLIATHQSSQTLQPGQCSDHPNRQQGPS
jgi:hypothetical protein